MSRFHGMLPNVPTRSTSSPRPRVGPSYVKGLPLLGHRSLATTERYLRLTITDLKEAHARFHRRERQ